MAPCAGPGRSPKWSACWSSRAGPSAAIGDFCEIDTAGGRRIRTQVIGFRDGRVLSMPLEEIDGLQAGDAVEARSEEARVEVGPRCWAA